MRLNHLQGYGCSFNGCTFEHSCLLCGREGHGVHQLRQNGTYRCQVMRKYMAEQCTNPLDDRQLRELFNPSTAAAAAQPSEVQSLTPAPKLLLSPSCQSSARAPSTAFKIHSWSGQQAITNAAADNQTSGDLDFPALPRAMAAESAPNSLTLTVDSDYSEASSSCSSSPNHSLCDSPEVPDSTSAKSEDEDLCVVCLEGPREVFFFPCGHRHTCAECAELVKDCPTCRAEIKGRCRAFL